MLQPIVVVSPAEIRQSLFHRHLKGVQTDNNVRINKSYESFRKDTTEVRVVNLVHLNGLCVVEVGTEVHEQLWHPGGHIIRAGQNAGTET